MPTAAVRNRGAQTLGPFFVVRYVLKKWLLRAGELACQFEMTALRQPVSISTV